MQDPETVQDPEVLLKVWAEHFQKLGESMLGATTDACQWKRKVESLESQSHLNEEFLLDVPFTAKEVSGAVSRLKGKKAPGPDGVMAEHLKFGGEVFVIWLMRILNAVIELEAIPEVLKRGVVVPVYKGGGMDPMRRDSYRGITLISGPGIPNAGEARFCVRGSRPTACQPIGLQKGCVLCRCHLCDTRSDSQVSQRRKPRIHVPVRSTKSIRLCRVPRAATEAVRRWCEQEDVETTEKLV